MNSGSLVKEKYVVFHGFNVTVVCFEAIWMFPKIVVPPNHPFVHRVFHYKPSIFGYLFSETSIFSSQVWEIFISRAPSGRIGVPGWQDVGLENGNKG